MNYFHHSYSRIIPKHPSIRKGGSTINPYPLLEELLFYIERNLNSALDSQELTAHLHISSIHLQRLFKFAFGLTLGRYIRARKLAASLNTLMTTQQSVLSIALEYGFAHEQSYIRAFRREYGLTPGEARQTRSIIEVTPPLQLLGSARLSAGALFGPEFVVVPQLQLLGIRHRIDFADAVAKPPLVAKQFWLEEMPRIARVVPIKERDVYYGLTRIPHYEEGWSTYQPSVHIHDLSLVLDGFHGDTFPSQLCVRFRYIGRHHYFELNADRAIEMYRAILSFVHDDRARYTAQNQSLYFERIADADYDGTYCCMEWFTPVKMKEERP